VSLESYKKLVEGKKIALVGPAKYMEGSGFGPDIDSHDLVVRINRGIESIEGYSKDIGNRTDIYYSCLIETYQQTGFLDPKQLKESYNIQYIVAPPESDFQGISSTNKFHYLVDLKKMQELQKHFPIRIIDYQFHTALAREVQCKPNTGFLSIYDLLNPALGIQQLSIYGFSFYLDGFLAGQKSGVEKEKGCTEQEFADMAFNSKRHVQKNMWLYAKHSLLHDKRVCLDPFLKEILMLREFDREVYEDIHSNKAGISKSS